jgi:hypothetical protein
LKPGEEVLLDRIANLPFPEAVELVDGLYKGNIDENDDSAARVCGICNVTHPNNKIFEIRMDSPFIKMLVNKCPDHDVYRKDVVEIQKSMRGLRSQPNIETIRTSLCKACENAYSKVRTDSESTFMPPFALVNGNRIMSDDPPELHGLSQLEKTCISLVVTFQSVFLIRSQSHKCCSSAICFFNDRKPVTKRLSLPRNANELKEGYRLLSDPKASGSRGDH